MTTPLYVLPNDDTISSQSSIAASVSSISTAASQTSNSENKRGKNRSYYFSSKHANFDEATQVIEQENMWRKVNKSKTKQYYQCNKTTTRNAKQCSSAVYLLSLNSFMSVAFGIMKKWSFGRDTVNNVNGKKFAEEPSISLNQWTESYNWKKTATIFQDLETDSSKYYCKSGNSNETISIEVVRKYESLMNECSWNSFQAFRNCAFGIWRITMPTNLSPTNWKKGICTCPTFYKKYICKHIIGIALRLTAVTNASTLMPITAKDVPISSKRKVGRPALARPALIRQPFTSIIETDDNEIDEIGEIDDDIEYNQQEDYTMNQEQRQNFHDNACALDCSVDINNDMFGLASYVTSKVASTPDSSIFDSIYNIDHISLIDVQASTSQDNTMPSTSASSILNSTDPVESIFKRKLDKNAESAPKKRGRPAKTDEQKAEDKRQRQILSKK